MTIKSNNPMLSNPLDELFNTPATRLDEDKDEYEQITEGELAEMASGEEAPPEKDEEDKEIDGKIDTVYQAAIDAFNQQTAYTEIIEPRYAARNAEVAANYLNIALSAAATRAKVKGERKRNAAFVPFANKTQNNVVVASRDEIMRMISIDAEVKEVK
jgi:hypothetical protein